MAVLLLPLAWCAASALTGAVWAVFGRHARQAELAQRRWDCEQPHVLAA